MTDQQVEQTTMQTNLFALENCACYYCFQGMLHYHELAREKGSHEAILESFLGTTLLIIGGIFLLDLLIRIVSGIRKKTFHNFFKEFLISMFLIISTHYIYQQFF